MGFNSGSAEKQIIYGSSPCSAALKPNYKAFLDKIKRGDLLYLPDRLREVTERLHNVACYCGAEGEIRAILDNYGTVDNQFMKNTAERLADALENGIFKHNEAAQTLIELMNEEPQAADSMAKFLVHMKKDLGGRFYSLSKNQLKTISKKSLHRSATACPDDMHDTMLQMTANGEFDNISEMKSLGEELKINLPEQPEAFPLALSVDSNEGNNSGAASENVWHGGGLYAFSRLEFPATINESIFFYIEIILEAYKDKSEDIVIIPYFNEKMLKPMESENETAQEKSTNSKEPTKKVYAKKTDINTRMKKADRKIIMLKIKGRTSMMQAQARKRRGKKAPLAHAIPRKCARHANAQSKMKAGYKRHAKKHAKNNGAKSGIKNKAKTQKATLKSQTKISARKPKRKRVKSQHIFWSKAKSKRRRGRFSG